MPVYRLTPIDLTDPDWQASLHQGEAIVRALSEHRALSLAAVMLGRATEWSGPANPWRQERPKKVRVELVNDTL